MEPPSLCLDTQCLLSSNPFPSFLSLPPARFEDSDFLGQLRLPDDQRAIKCEIVCREEAVEVWRQYRVLAEKGQVKHY